MTQAEMLGIVRAVLTSAGGGLVANGVVSSADWQTIVGAVVIVAGALWSWLQKKQAHTALVNAAQTGVIAPATATSAISPAHI